MHINDQLLNKLEKLSSLKIGEDRRDEIKNQLSEIVNFVEVLNELDLSNNEAVVSMATGGTLLRDDSSYQSDVIDEILKNSPQRDGKFFVVPKIIE